VISVQKSLQDILEELSVTDIYYPLSWFLALRATLLLIIGLWNTAFLLSEKGFMQCLIG
jgi:uncharacterized membrane protein YiaA